ncbi:MAG: cellulase family glycosylhydrolase [Prolixibacteraceae bacterium]|nr:cellulase family glycosylhydrolase [Prolixibacteraceae bacterium]
MRYFKEALILLTLIAFGAVSYAATNVPFSRGFNLTNWFQVSSPQQIQFSKYTKQDFENIKSLGCDVIRLPINLHSMTSGEPDYTLDPLFLTFLDEVVSWAEELEMHLILDNHTFSVEDDTDPDVGDILEKVWTQMATHYLDASTLIYYEVLNEPHGIADNTWNTIQQEVVEAIREVDRVHTIIVGPASWNSYNHFEFMPEYDDDNLIYTFHFYDPFLFTHQGAGWAELADLEGIPFPYDPERMPEFPESLKNHWSYNNFLNYDEHGTVEEVHRLIDIAVEFQQERNVPVYCGELGVYDLVSPNDDRTFWYGVVTDYLEEKGIAWTIWDYHGGFGIFNKGGNGFFEHDLNVELAEIVGLTAPEQTPLVINPDSVGTPVYLDYFGQRINEASNTAGRLSYYSENHSNSGNYCIEWSGAEQYNTITFDFSPDKDLSLLVDEGYALSLVLRGDNPNGQYDIRFIDTKTDDPDDHPWRSRFVVNNSKVDWDGQWHKLFIPLSDFDEQGSWDVDTWYNPVGDFDWSAIDKLEIVTEYGSQGEYTLWVDDVVITNMDTTQTIVISSAENVFSDNPDFCELKYYPGSRLVEMKNKTQTPLSYKLFDLSGKTIWNDTFFMSTSRTVSGLRQGMYIIQLTHPANGTVREKLLIK